MEENLKKFCRKQDHLYSIKRAKNNFLYSIKKQIRRPFRDDFLRPVLSIKYKDPLLKLSDDRLTVTGYKGWSTACATHCVEEGKWYYEARINTRAFTPSFVGYSDFDSPKTDPHVRIGWACRFMRYDSPIGLDLTSFAIRDTDGAVVNSSKVVPYAHASFGEGDIIGCFITLEYPTWCLPDPRKQAKLHEFIEAGILCDPKNPPVPSKNVGSSIEFSINGKRFGKIFTDIPCGSYHPSVSLYMGATVSMNFGPKFAYRPPDDFRMTAFMSRPVFL